jgi:hypothetical protein
MLQTRKMIITSGSSSVGYDERDHIALHTMEPELYEWLSNVFIFFSRFISLLYYARTTQIQITSEMKRYTAQDLCKSIRRCK